MQPFPVDFVKRILFLNKLAATLLQPAIESKVGAATLIAESTSFSVASTFELAISLCPGTNGWIRLPPRSCLTNAAVQTTHFLLTSSEVNSQIPVSLAAVLAPKSLDDLARKKNPTLN